MNDITASVICDSINRSGTRLTTFQVHCPKFLLQEIARHRVFSLSFNSARAIPAKVMRISATFEPEAWLSNQPGMTGGKELTGIKLFCAKLIWRSLSIITKLGHKGLQASGLHKQYTNRWLEPIVWVDGVISSTDWDNYIALRAHPAAQPEMQALAYAIKRLLSDHKPKFLIAGEWHLPYIEKSETSNFDIAELCMISAARCARVSYGFSNIRDVAADFKRAEMLIVSKPSHFSPFEHVAFCPELAEIKTIQSGNYRDWAQLRQMMEA